MSAHSPFSARLRIKLQLARGREEIDRPLPSSQKVRSWYKEYIFIIHSIIRSSVPLMQAAYERCNLIPDEGTLVSKLKRYYQRHILEEKNHDEWLLEDLESINIPRRRLLRRKPPEAVAELVGSQYYWIYHWHPVCLLGYISFSEGNPPKKQIIDQLQKITGYPETAFRTLAMHSDLDHSHRDALNKLLELLSLSPKHEEWITSNALYTATKFREIVNNIHLHG